MASAAVASLAKLVNQIMPNLQSYFLLCPRKKMASLQDNLVFLQDFLQNSGESTISEWDARIREAAEQSKDIIQSHVSKKDTARNEEEFGAFQRCINQFDSIVAEVKEIPEKENNLPARTSSRGKESMVGVDEDLIQIKDRVTGEEQNLQIIPITGMGGIGKTTLARNVYEDKLTVEFFDTRHWVTISQEYSVPDILGSILSVQGEKAEILIERVYKSLKGRRYLIVMDDIWDSEVWFKVRWAFPDECNGSRVIITTRLSEVALNIDSESRLHRMQLLDKDKSWALFRSKAFANEYCPPSRHMEKIGKSIARNCRGLPLAIVVMAGMLKANKTIEYWENIAKNVNVASTINDDRYSGIFSLSYSNLPRHLKSCFLYMGFFAEDYEIPVKKLIKLWVADDFLEPSSESKSLEELAEEYLEDLVERSLVLAVDKRSNRRIRSCKIHDVLRDLSITKGREERFVQHFTYMDKSKITLSKLVESQHRLIIHTDESEILKTEIHTSTLHTFLYFGLKTSTLSSFASKLTSLRMLGGELLVDSTFFPDEIFELVNLKYLAFTQNERGECVISPSISKLQNLQTLIIERRFFLSAATCVVILPPGIWKMPRLRHLDLAWNTLLAFPCQRRLLRRTYSALEDLQTLSMVMNFKFPMEAVQRFPNLKKLGIQYHNITPDQWGLFELENLVCLQELEELDFRYLPAYIYEVRYPLDKILAFPQRLRKLTLSRSCIPWEKMSMVGSLPNLEVLKLMENSFVGKEWETTEGEFLVLKYLQMQGLNLRDWRVESGHFQCLESLIILWCRELKEVPSSVGDIPTLQSIEICSCKVEVDDSVRRIEVEQQSLGNDLKVSITPQTKEI